MDMHTWGSQCVSTAVRTHRKITSLVTWVVTRLCPCNLLQGDYKLVIEPFGLVMANTLQACNERPKTNDRKHVSHK